MLWAFLFAIKHALYIIACVVFAHAWQCSRLVVNGNTVNTEGCILGYSAKVVTSLGRKNILAVLYTLGNVGVHLVTQVT